MSQALANTQPDAVENLIKLARKHEPLYKSYRAIRKVLFDDSQAQVRDKGFRGQDNPKSNDLGNENISPPSPAEDAPDSEKQKLAEVTTTSTVSKPIP